MKKRLVSFILAAYNEEKYIIECVESCLHQTYENVEVVITDDGSTDSTVSLLREKYHNEKRVKLISPPLKVGKVSAFNSSFAECRGDYIALMGADDINYPDRIEKQMEVLETYDLVSCDLERVDSSNTLTLNRFMFGAATNTIKEFDFDTMIYSPFGNGSIIMKRKVAEKAFPLPVDLPHEDFWIPLIASFYGKVAYYDEPLYKYRIHENNTSGLFKNMNDLKNLIYFKARDFNYYQNVLRFLTTQKLESYKPFIESKIYFSEAVKYGFEGINGDRASLEKHLRSLNIEDYNKKFWLVHLYRKGYLYLRFKKWEHAMLILDKLKSNFNRDWIEIRICILFKLNNPQTLRKSFLLSKTVSLICKIYPHR